MNTKGMEIVWIKHRRRTETMRGLSYAGSYWNILGLKFWVSNILGVKKIGIKNNGRQTFWRIKNVGRQNFEDSMFLKVKKNKRWGGGVKRIKSKNKLGVQKYFEVNKFCR
jgi:hypothetical protein